MMLLLENFEVRHKNYIGYVYALLSIFFLSTISIGSKALKHLPGAETLIYRFIPIYIISYFLITSYNIKFGNGTEIIILIGLLRVLPSPSSGISAK